MRYNPEEAARQLERDEAEWAGLKARLMGEELIDEDGYPTEAALELVSKWHWSDTEGLLEFVKGLWHLRDWGWGEVDAKHLIGDDRDHNPEGGKLYLVSTAGWSGNESLIAALKKNSMAWSLCWVESRRGGHYRFRPYIFADDQ